MSTIRGAKLVWRRISDGRIAHVPHAQGQIAKSGPVTTTTEAYGYRAQGLVAKTSVGTARTPARAITPTTSPAGQPADAKDVRPSHA